MPQSGMLNRPKSQEPRNANFSSTSSEKASETEQNQIIEIRQLRKTPNPKSDASNSLEKQNDKSHGKRALKFYLPDDKKETSKTESSNHLPKLKPDPLTQSSKSRKVLLEKDDKLECYQFHNLDDFCQAVGESRIASDYKEIQGFLEKTFGSFSELVRVFKVKSSSPGINFEYLDYVNESIIRMPKEVQKVILRSIINCMLNDRRGVRTNDDLIAFLILLLCPLFSDTSTYVIFAHVLRNISMSQNKDHHQLILMLQKLPGKEFKGIVERIKKLVNYRLFPKKKDDIPEGEKSAWWIPNGVKVLALLNAANEQSRLSLLSRSDFYIRAAEGLDLVKEYQSWQSGSHNFSFCQYPFALSLNAKRYIMQKDSETKMLMEARQSLVKKVRQKQVPSMGMLFLNLNVDRKNILADSLREISLKQKDLKKKLRVIFKGEPGIDLGGVSKEWFFLIMQRFFNADYGMFKYNEKTHLWWFNSSSKENFQEFNLCGVLMGLAMYNGINLDIRFPPCLYRKLLTPAIVPYNNPHAPVGLIAMGLTELKQVYPDLTKGLQELLDYEGDVENDLCQTFQVSFSEFGEVITRLLKPNGQNLPVTNENRKEYVNLYVDYLLNRCIYQQFYSFYHGFHSVCASNALLLLRPEEVETLVIGNSEFNIKDLEKVASLDGFSMLDATIRYLWDTVFDYTPEMQRKFLFFCTGSDRIPVGGMKEMKFKVTRVGGKGSTQMLPMAHTCFNQLCLPPYKSRKALQKKMSIAIENAEGFGIE